MGAKRRRLPPANHGAEFIAVDASQRSKSSRTTAAILELVSHIPRSEEVASPSPDLRVAILTSRASKKAAGISGAAALIPGPLGLFSLLPDLLAVWKVQRQLVADIAATYGKSSSLTGEQMLYCLFRHLLSHGVRDLAMRVGERIVFRRASIELLQRIAGHIGVRVTQRMIGRAFARYAPLVGAAGGAIYAYYDTRQVASAAKELFSRESVLAPDLSA